MTYKYIITLYSKYDEGEVFVESENRITEDQIHRYLEDNHDYSPECGERFDTRLVEFDSI